MNTMFFGSSLLLGSFAGKKSNPDILEFAKFLKFLLGKSEREEAMKRSCLPIVTSPPPISLWITGHLSELFRPREIKVSHFT
jgi:hypothetical protein